MPEQALRIAPLFQAAVEDIRREFERRAQAEQAQREAKRAIPVCLSEQPLDAKTVYAGMNAESSSYEARVVKAGTAGKVFVYSAKDEPRQCTTAGAVVDALALPKDASERLFQVMSEPNATPLLALAQRMNATEKGGAPIERLVLSGHAATLFGHGEKFRYLPPNAVETLADVFPKAAAGVKDLMLSACYTGYARSMQEFRTQFPGVENILAYDGTAPSALADKDIRYFLRTTAEDKPVRRKDVPSAPNTKLFPATWTKTEGYQSRSPQTFADAMDEVNRLDEVWEKYVSGETPKEHGPNDQQLRLYYVALQLAAEAQDAPADEVTKLQQRMREVMAVRHPDWQ